MKWRISFIGFFIFLYSLFQITSLLLTLFLDYFPFCHAKSHHSGSLLNDVFIELCTKDNVFKYLDTSVTSVELNDKQIIFMQNKASLNWSLPGSLGTSQTRSLINPKSGPQVPPILVAKNHPVLSLNMARWARPKNWIINGSWAKLDEQKIV